MWDESAAAAFLPLLPDGHPLPGMNVDTLTSVLRDPAVRLVLAEEDGATIGYTAFGSSRDDDAPPDVGEVRTFFVRPGAWRRGVGSALMTRALADLPEMGFHHATVWSFADNARANAFYEHHGFERDGTEQRDDMWAGLLEVRYRRPTI